MDIAKINFTMTYFTGVAQDQFKVGPNQKDKSILQDQLSNWDLFVDKLHRYFGLSDPIGEAANMLDNLCIKSGDKISTYNMDFMHYASQLDWGNSVLCHRYYQRLPNQIQDPIPTWEQGKPILFQDMYALAMIIDYYYWEHDYRCHCARQAEKEALESHSQKQGKASTSSSAIASQNKANTSPVVSSAKTSSKSSPSPASKKQSNSLQVDLSSKLASNGKLTSDKHKKHLENNLYLYCSAGDHKLDFYLKKQTMVTPKGHGASATANPPAAASKKPLEK